MDQQLAFEQIDNFIWGKNESSVDVRMAAEYDVEFLRRQDPELAKGREQYQFPNGYSKKHRITSLASTWPFGPNCTISIRQSRGEVPRRIIWI